MSWGVVLTQPNCEALALRNLERQGFVCYLPWLKVRITKQGKVHERTRPLFSRYLFVLLERSWSAVRGTRGVACLIAFSDKPATIPSAAIDALRARECEGCVDLPHRYQRGERVKIESGSFAGMFGIYQGMTAKQREIVLLELLGRKVPVELAASDLA